MRNAQQDIQDGEVGPWICFFIVIAFNFLAYFMNERNIFQRCCPCTPRFLAITNRAGGVPKSQRPRSFFAWDLLDATHLTAGARVPALAVLLLRAFCVVVFVFDILWELFGVKRLRGQLETSKLRFFTNWTFYGFGLCNLLGLAISFKAVMKRPPADTTWKSPTPQSTPYTFLDKAFHFVYMGVAPASSALSLFYWALVYDGRPVTVDNVLKHGTSFGLLVADLLLSRMAIVSYHAAVPVWYATAYAIFLWIYYDIDGSWAYTALDWTSPVRAINYFAMVLLILLSLLLLYGLAGLRELLITGKCCCMCGCCAGCGDCCVPRVENDEEFLAEGTAPMYKAPNSHQFMTSS